jgi:hypothetical protein
MDVEINDVWSNRFLPVELHTMELFSPQSRPQDSLGVSHGFPQFTGWLLQIAAVVEH